MISVKIAVNGDDIITLTATNEGPVVAEHLVEGAPEGICVYAWESSDDLRGTFSHHRPSGAAQCAAEMLRSYQRVRFMADRVGGS